MGSLFHRYVKLGTGDVPRWLLHFLVIIFFFLFVFLFLFECLCMCVCVHLSIYHFYLSLSVSLYTFLCVAHVRLATEVAGFQAWYERNTKVSQQSLWIKLSKRRNNLYNSINKQTNRFWAWYERDTKDQMFQFWKITKVVLIHLKVKSLMLLEPYKFFSL